MWLTCLHCGQTYYGNGKFCTSKCVENFLNPPVYIKPVTKKCHWCGKESEKTFCSDECKKENSRSGSVPRTCQFCGKEFMGSYTTKFCSDDCRAERKPDKCIQCGGPMPADYIGACSPKCAIAFGERDA